MTPDADAGDFFVTTSASLARQVAAEVAPAASGAAEDNLCLKSASRCERYSRSPSLDAAIQFC